MILSERSHLFVFATSHPGMSGKNNEDNYAVSAHRVGKTDPTPSLFAIVADGVGGHRAGEVASEIAIETISQIVSDSNASNPPEILEFAIVRAGQAVNNQSESKEHQQGMGSTCACVWVIADRLYTASVGDSRIYFVREGQIRQITTDHTWVQEAIEHGIIQPDQARNHPRAHVIRRYLGSQKPVEPDFRLRWRADETDEQAFANQGMQLLPGDQLLLCSDGLTDLVDDPEILENLQKEDLQEGIHHLVDMANERGGHDNITIVSLQVPPAKTEDQSPIQSEGKRESKLRRQTYVAIGVILAVVTILSVIVFLYWSSPGSASTATPTATTAEISLPTQVITEETNPPVTPTREPTETPIRATYTPWPTDTPQP